jgi:hypothetical protein
MAATDRRAHSTSPAHPDNYLSGVLRIKKVHDKEELRCAVDLNQNWADHEAKPLFHHPTGTFFAGL